MRENQLIAGLDQASTLDISVMYVKVMATGISLTLLVFISVFALSRRGQRDRDSVVAGPFALANLFATLYVTADTVVRIDVLLGDFSHTLVYYRIALSAVVLSVAAYANLYLTLDRRRNSSPHLKRIIYAVATMTATLVWIDHPWLIIANETLTVRGASVFADYGAMAPWFFALSIALFGGVCMGLLRLTRDQGHRRGLQLNLLGFGLLLAAGVHDSLRELGVYILPLSMLSIGYACFQVGAFAFVGLHYSRTLRERRSQRHRLEDLRERVAHDSRTGLYTRGFLEELLDRRPPPAGSGLLFIDLDDFKAVNDRFGHLRGDTVLRAVADTLRANVREGDFPCRWGGDEFLVYLVDTDAEKVRALAARLRGDLEALRIDNAVDPGIRVSMGYAVITGPDWRSSLAQADQALYDSKRAGKDRLTMTGISA